MRKKIFIICTLLISIIGVFIYIQLIPKTKEDTSYSNDDTEQDTPIEDSDEGNTILQHVCQTALQDYPKWLRQTEVVVMDEHTSGNSKLFFRESPEEGSVTITSPAQGSEKLVDMELVDTNAFGFAKLDSDNLEIGIMTFSGVVGTQTYFSKQNVTTIRDVSFLGNNRIIILYQTNSQKIVLSSVNVTTQKEKIIKEFSLKDVKKNTDYAKIAVSPDGNYVYVKDHSLKENDTSILIYDLQSQKLVYEIKVASSPVWVGDFHILYASTTSESGVYLYGIKDKQSFLISGIDIHAKNLAFNPQSNGIIAYTKDNTAYIISCQEFETIATYQNSTFNAFTNKDTAIITAASQDLAGSGFWRFITNWTVLISKNINTYISRPALATAWSRY